MHTVTEYTVALWLYLLFRAVKLCLLLNCSLSVNPLCTIDHLTKDCFSPKQGKGTILLKGTVHHFTIQHHATESSVSWTSQIYYMYGGCFMIVYCMMMASSVQSFMPIPLLHFILNPLIRRLVALRMAKDIWACTHPITSLPLQE